MDTGPDEGQADGLGEVDVEAAGHGTGDARAAVGDKPDNCFVGAGSAAVISVRPGPCLRKSGGEEGFGDFRTDLEAVRTDAGTDYRKDVFRLSAVFGSHHSQGLRCDFYHSTFPA